MAVTNASLHIKPQLSHGADLPEAVPPNYQDDEKFLMAAHHALMEVGVGGLWSYENLYHGPDFLLGKG